MTGRDQQRLQEEGGQNYGNLPCTPLQTQALRAIVLHWAGGKMRKAALPVISGLVQRALDGLPRGQCALRYWFPSLSVARDGHGSWICNLRLLATWFRLQISSSVPKQDMCQEVKMVG